MTRGQASTEFLMLVALLSIVFVLLVNYFFGYSVSIGDFSRENGYKSVCSKISDETSFALAAGPLYSREFYLPGGDYSASLQNYEVDITYPGGQVACALAANVSANLNNGRNLLIYNESGIYFQ